MALLRWLASYGEFTVSGDTPWRFFTRAGKLGYNLWGITPLPGGGVRACVRFRALKELEPLAADCGCTLAVETVRGPQRALGWLWGRKGMLAGLLLAAILYGELTGRMWNITVQGNAAYTPEQVLAAAAECGLYPGVRKRDFDPRAVSASLLLRLDKAGWVSVNTRDSFAVIALREAVPKPEPVETEGLSMISAAREGQILSCEALAGRLLVAPGDVVQAGQMLVSGVQESTAGDTLFVNARAKILARTWRTFTVELPVTVGEDRPTGETLTRRSLQLFSLHIPLGFAAAPRAQGESTFTCEPLVLLGVEVPAALHTQRWSGTETVFRRRTEEELAAAAEAALLALAQEALGEAGTIEEQMVELSIQGEWCTARMTCTCVEDIAKEIPIVITGEP